MFRILRCRGAARCWRGSRSRGDERVADLGCGTGRLTRELAARLPHGDVVALDASRQMLDQAVAHLADVSPAGEIRRGAPSGHSTGWLGGRRVQHRDIPLGARSSGALLEHPDGTHTRRPAACAVRRRSQSRAGARTGRGGDAAACVCALVRGLRGRLGICRRPRHRRSAREPRVSPRSRRHSNPRRSTFTDEASYRAYVTTVVFRLHLARLPEALRPAFLDEIVERVRRLPQGFTLDYWRLNLRARRPALRRCAVADSARAGWPAAGSRSSRLGGLSGQWPSKRALRSARFVRRPSPAASRLRIKHAYARRARNARPPPRFHLALSGSPIRRPPDLPDPVARRSRTRRGVGRDVPSAMRRSWVRSEAARAASDWRDGAKDEMRRRERAVRAACVGMSGFQAVAPALA